VKDTALAHSVSGNPRVASDHTQRFVLDPVVAAATACDAKRVVALGAEPLALDLQAGGARCAH
jgi:hypothetical protein